MPALTAAMAISIHNAWLNLRRRRTQKARTPNGRNASTVFVVDIRTCPVLKPSGRVAGVWTARTLAVLVNVLVQAGDEVVAKHTVCGVIKQVTYDGC